MEQSVAIKRSMSIAAPPASPFLQIGRRIIAVRRAYGLTQIAFAKQIEVRQNTLSEWENGERRIGIDSALRMCEEFHVTLDYIYRGDHSTLHHLRLAEALRYGRRLK